MRTILGIAAILALLSAPARAAEPEPAGPLCSPTVSAALTAWDLGLETAAKFGDKAVAVAREKGRDYILPLLGLDPKTAPSGDDGTSAIGRALESSRQDPAQRLALCMTVTEAVENAKGTASAGLDALKRAMDRFAAPPAPAGKVPADSRGLINT